MINLVQASKANQRRDWLDASAPSTKVASTPKREVFQCVCRPVAQYAQRCESGSRARGSPVEPHPVAWLALQRALRGYSTPSY